jgi:hypothetical protein
MYLPQEPTFLNGTIRDNFLAASPELDEEGMNRVLRDAGLGPFIDESPKGLETEIANVGLSLALGIRRRLPLARATATGGRLVVFDEPTEGLDDEGRAATYPVIKNLVQRKHTIVIISHDETIPLKTGFPIFDFEPALIARRLANKTWEDRVRFFNNAIMGSLEQHLTMHDYVEGEFDRYGYLAWFHLSAMKMIGETLELWQADQPESDAECVLYALSLHPGHCASARGRWLEEQSFIFAFNQAAHQWDGLRMLFNAIQVTLPGATRAWFEGVPDDPGVMFRAP